MRSDVPREPQTTALPPLGLDGLRSPSEDERLYLPRTLPRWGMDLPSDVDGPYGPMFDRAAQTVLWSTAEQLAQEVLPGAGSLVRIAFFLGRYQAIHGGLNDGRDAGPRAGLSFGFTMKLGAWDDGVSPRHGVLVELNYLEHKAEGEPEFEGPSRTALVVTEPREPFSSLIDMFGRDAVRDHATVLGLAASLTTDDVTGLIRALRRRWVRLTAKFDHAGLGTITVHDGQKLELMQVQL